MPLPSPQVALVVKNAPANAGAERDLVRSLDGEDALEEGVVTHRRMPWKEEPGGLQSIGLQRVDS